MQNKNLLAELKAKYHRLQSSSNYWNNAASAARKAANKHTGQRQTKDMERLADFEKKAIAAAQQLNAVKHQLTELDPNGAQARQFNALRSAINRAKRDILNFQHLANLPGLNEETLGHFRAKLDARRAKLAQLETAMTQQRQEAEATAQKALANKAYENECLAIVNTAYGFNPNDPNAHEQLEALDARHAGVLVVTDMDTGRHNKPAKSKGTMH